MEALNVELPIVSQTPPELSRSIEGILEILIALDEGAVRSWIREKYPIASEIYGSEPAG